MTNNKNILQAYLKFIESNCTVNAESTIKMAGLGQTI